MQDPDIILYESNLYKPIIDKANKLTEAYVSEHKLILTGGMAIDLALRAKGDQIYDDNAVPDFDIISDHNLDHANALAKILCNEGIPDVNVINAIHITTVRVRVRNIPFLDATYIPTKCFERIPYLDIGQFRVVHPFYQFIDQRLSLSALMAEFGGSTNSDHRFIKDITRNELLRSYYAIENQNKVEMYPVLIPLNKIKIDVDKLMELNDAFIYTGNSCIAGYAAISILLDKFKLKDDHVEVMMPKDMPIRLLTCDSTFIEAHTKRPKIFRPLLNLKPITLKEKSYEYVDTYGMRVSANMIKLSSEISVCIAGVDYLLMELLRDRIYISEEPFSSTYNEIVKIVDKHRNNESNLEILKKFDQALLEQLLEGTDKDLDEEQIMKLKMHLDKQIGADAKWLPTSNIYGKDFLPEYRMAMLEKLIDPERYKTLKPKNSYLSEPECKTKTGFNFDDSHYYNIDGSEDNTIIHTNYKHIVESFHDLVNQKKKESE